MNSTDPLVYRIRGHAESVLRDRAGAMADMNKAVDLAQFDEMSYTTRANIEMFWDDFPGASNDLEKAISMNPRNPDIIAARGALEWKEGNTGCRSGCFKSGYRHGRPGTF